MSTMEIHSPDGHTEITWDPDNADETGVARETFERMTRDGYHAFRTENGGKAGRMTEFDPAAESMVLVRQLKGG